MAITVHSGKNRKILLRGVGDMRYWCPECKSEIIEGEDINKLNDACCPICNEEEALEIILDYETPEQYKKRTGKKWNGLVWWRWGAANKHHCKTWHYGINIENGYDVEILCANPPEPPPVDFVP